MKFESYHPVINLIYFVYVIVCTVLFRHPFFVLCSFLSSFIYSVKLKGKKALILNIILTILTVPYALWYAFYNHFGVTELRQNFIGNSITLESTVYGLVLGFIIISVVMWMECVHDIMTADKWIYLLGRISPKCSLFLSIALRMIPRIKTRHKKVDDAQCSVGRGMRQGKFLRRIFNWFREASMVLTWFTEDLVTVSDSMRSRGYTLRGRTAFSIYRFDNRDRCFVLVMFFTISSCLAAHLLDQTNILYDPRIIFNPMTFMSYVFYAVYMLSCLLPMIVEIIGEESFRRSRGRVSGKNTKLEAGR